MRREAQLGCFRPAGCSVAPQPSIWGHQSPAERRSAAALCWAEAVGQDLLRSNRHPGWSRVLGVDEVTGIQDPGRFKAKNLSLFIGAGSVFHATRHDDAFSGQKFDDLISKFDAE